MRRMDLADPAAASDPGHLARLNPAQRAAVLHGDGAVAGPLLVIAGAGTGKTNTLVHRLAHLVLAGADPRRILLMTFSRRAAAEMTRRAERIAAEVMGPKASVLAEGLTWAGTFHAIGARLLRDHAGAIGLDPGFTIHDREDSADLMNLARHRLGFSATERRFPAKATCLAIYSRAVNAQAPLGEVLGRHFPWCAEWAPALKELFAAYVAAKQESARPRLRRPAALLGRDDAGAGARRRDRRPVRPCPRRRVPGHQPAAGGDPARAEAGRQRPDRGRRRRPVDLRLPRRGGAQHPRLPRRSSRRRARIVTLEENYRSTPQILAAANAVIAEASEGYAKELRSDRPAGPRPALAAVRDEAGQVDYVCRQILDAREAGTALKEQAVLFRAAHHSGPLEVELTRRNIPFVKFGGLKFLDAAHVKDMLACLRLAENPADRIAGFRVLQLIPGIGPATAEAVLAAMAAAPEPALALAAARVPDARRRRLGRLRRPLRRPARRRRRLAGRARGGAQLVRAAPRPPARRRRRSAAPTSSSSRRSPPATRAASAS